MGPAENVVRGNVVEASGVADIVVGSGRRPIEDLGNDAEVDLPPIPDLVGMHDPERAPATPATDMPPSFDTALLEVPTGPLFTRGG